MTDFYVVTADYTRATQVHDEKGGWLLRYRGGYAVCDDDAAIKLCGIPNDVLTQRHEREDWADPPYETVAEEEASLEAIRWLVAVLGRDVREIPGFSAFEDAIRRAVPTLDDYITPAPQSTSSGHPANSPVLDTPSGGNK